MTYDTMSDNEVSDKKSRRKIKTNDNQHTVTVSH